MTPRTPRERAIFKARIDLIVSTKLDWRTEDADAYSRLHALLREGVRRGLVTQYQIRGVKRVKVNFEEVS